MYDTLIYESSERRLKIYLVFQDELGREASAEEVEKYVTKRISTDDLRAELSKR